MTRRRDWWSCPAVGRVELEDAAARRPACALHVRQHSSSVTHTTSNPAARRRVAASHSIHFRRAVCCCAEFLLRCSRRPGSRDLGASGMNVLTHSRAAGIIRGGLIPAKDVRYFIHSFISPQNGSKNRRETGLN